MTASKFPRWFCNISIHKPMVRRYDGEGHGIRLPHNIPTSNTFKDALDLVNERIWRELTEDEAREIISQ
jgi:hypothetical protein